MNYSLRAVYRRVRALDLALILSVHLFIVSVYLLPEGVQNSLVLDYGSPSVFTVWSSAFVHRGFTHLSGNLETYTVLISLVYLWFTLAGEDRLFRYTFAGFLIPLPVIISTLNLSLLNLGTNAGFSGIAAAFNGALPFTLFLYLHNQVSEEIQPVHATALFMIALAFTSVTVSSLKTGAAILLVAGLMIGYYVYDIGLGELREALQVLQGCSALFFAALVSVLLFLVSPAVLFPAEIVRSSGVVNTFSHYLGMAFGFFGPTFYWLYREKI